MLMFYLNLTTPADTLYENLHAFCWPVQHNFLIWGEKKALEQQLRSKMYGIF